MKVFISHTHDDEEYASRLADSLRREGITVWLDKEQIRTGEKSAEAVRRGLVESDLILTVVSARPNPETFNQNVFFEAGMAIGMGKPVRLIIPEAEIKSGRLPFNLVGKKTLIRRTPSATARELIQSEHLGVKVATQQPSRSGAAQRKVGTNR